MEIQRNRGDKWPAPREVPANAAHHFDEWPSSLRRALCEEADQYLSAYVGDYIKYHVNIRGAARTRGNVYCEAGIYIS